MRGTLQAVIIGPESSIYTPEQIVELGEFVNDARVETPPGVSEWSVGNGILDKWSGLYLPLPISPTWGLIFTGLTVL